MEITEGTLDRLSRVVIKKNRLKEMLDDIYVTLSEIKVKEVESSFVQSILCYWISDYAELEIELRDRILDENSKT